MKAMTREMIIILLLIVLTMLPSLMDKDIYAKEDKFGITEIYPTSPNGSNTQQFQPDPGSSHYQWVSQ
jgi:hypothetical protein